MSSAALDDLWPSYHDNCHDATLIQWLTDEEAFQKELTRIVAYRSDLSIDAITLRAIVGTALAERLRGKRV